MIIQTDETYLDTFLVKVFLNKDINTKQEYENFKNDVCVQLNVLDFINPEHFLIENKCIYLKMKVPYSKMDYSYYMESKLESFNEDSIDSIPCSDTQKEWFREHQEEVLNDILDDFKNSETIIDEFEIDYAN